MNEMQIFKQAKELDKGQLFMLLEEVKVSERNEIWRKMKSVHTKFLKIVSENCLDISCTDM